MEFRLLGPLEARSGRKRLRLGGPKQRGVLALLLLNANEVVSVDRLIDDLWGERPPKTAEAYVQNCISRLRGVLGHDRIETEAPGYRLRVEASALDTVRFERALELAAALEPSARAAALREALALWRGPPLADLAFESFAQTEIARLDELRLTALERRLEAELELGRHDAVLAEIEALAMRHPARERLPYLQMLALYRAGRQRDALRVYQEARLELVEQFGLEPGEDLRALERMIIAHDPALRLAPVQPIEEAQTAATLLVVELLATTREALAASLAEIALVVDRNGGTPSDPSGEEVEARFGGGDDDTLRALRAAIEIRDASTDHGARIAIERGSATEIHEQARRMLATARPGDLLLGPAALRLVSRAVDVVPHEAGVGYRVLRFDPRAEPFARRLDAPLVGRVSELTRLETELDAALQTRSPRRAVVVGDAGIGKTRLARELVARVRRPAHVLSARCVPYGEGAALLPLLELMRQLGGVEQLGVATDADRFWALRRSLEELGQDDLIVLVLDDVQWAAAAFLDLVEYLSGWTEAALVLLCLARPELLEARPDWRDDVLFLGPLEAHEAHELAAGLPDYAGLDASSVAAAVDAADGNPLFLEQLIAFKAEAGEGEIPPTLEVLVQSRLDQLPTLERAVLERASVVGREFWRAAVEAASPDDARAAVGGALMSLVRRRLVHAARASISGEDGFRFHHALIRDAVYRTIPSKDRAVLHESVARSLDGRSPELDEVVGYHLEQAAILAPALELAREARERLGAAGLRALKRIDPRAAADLLTRANALVDADDELELELALATAVKFAGDPQRADALLEQVAGKALEQGDAVIELRARIEQAWRWLAMGQQSLSEVVALLDRAKEVLAAEGDDFGLGRVWHLTTAVQGVYAFRCGDLEEAVHRARHHYERAGAEHAPTLALLAVVAYRGPTAVVAAIARCEELLDEAPTPVWESFVLPPLAAVEAMDGRFDAAREHLAEALIRRREFSDTGTIVTSWSYLAAEVELLAGAAARAEEILSSSCAALRQAGDVEWLATNTALLGEALCRQGRFAEAYAAGEEALAIGPPGHLTSSSVARRVCARALARLGRLDEAVSLATETVALLQATDVLDERGEALAACGEVLSLAGAAADAAGRCADAVAMFERKGNRVSAERVRSSVLAVG